MLDGEAIAYEEGLSDGIKITHLRYEYLVKLMVTKKILCEQTAFASRIIK